MSTFLLYSSDKITRLTIDVGIGQPKRLAIVKGNLTEATIREKVMMKVESSDPSIQVKYGNSFVLLDDDVASIMDTSNEWEVRVR